jgi:hypothetical protein
MNIYVVASLEIFQKNSKNSDRFYHFDWRRSWSFFRHFIHKHFYRDPQATLFREEVH